MQIPLLADLLSSNTAVLGRFHAIFRAAIFGDYLWQFGNRAGADDRVIAK